MNMLRFSVSNIRRNLGRLFGASPVTFQKIPAHPKRAFNSMNDAAKMKGESELLGAIERAKSLRNLIEIYKNNEMWFQESKCYHTLLNRVWNMMKNMHRNENKEDGPEHDLDGLIEEGSKNLEKMETKSLLLLMSMSTRMFTSTGSRNDKRRAWLERIGLEVETRAKNGKLTEKEAIVGLFNFSVIGYNISKLLTVLHQMLQEKEVHKSYELLDAESVIQYFKAVTMNLRSPVPRQLSYLVCHRKICDTTLLMSSVLHYFLTQEKLPQFNICLIFDSIAVLKLNAFSGTLAVPKAVSSLMKIIAVKVNELDEKERELVLEGLGELGNLVEVSLYEQIVAKEQAALKTGTDYSNDHLVNMIVICSRIREKKLLTELVQEMLKRHQSGKLRIKYSLIAFVIESLAEHVKPDSEVAKMFEKLLDQLASEIRDDNYKLYRTYVQGVFELEKRGIKLKKRKLGKEIKKNDVVLVKWNKLIGGNWDGNITKEQLYEHFEVSESEDSPRWDELIQKWMREAKTSREQMYIVFLWKQLLETDSRNVWKGRIEQHLDSLEAKNQELMYKNLLDVVLMEEEYSWLRDARTGNQNRRRYLEAVLQIFRRKFEMLLTVPNLMNLFMKVVAAVRVEHLQKHRSEVKAIVEEINKNVNRLSKESIETLNLFVLRAFNFKCIGLSVSPASCAWIHDLLLQKGKDDKEMNNRDMLSILDVLIASSKLQDIESFLKDRHTKKLLDALARDVRDGEVQSLVTLLKLFKVYRHIANEMARSKPAEEKVFLARKKSAEESNITYSKEDYSNLLDIVFQRLVEKLKGAEFIEQNNFIQATVYVCSYASISEKIEDLNPHILVTLLSNASEKVRKVADRWADEACPEELGRACRAVGEQSDMQRDQETLQGEPR